MIESLECMKGNGPADLETIVAVQGAILLCDAGITFTQEQGEKMILQTFRDGTALEKFLQILGNQGAVKHGFLNRPIHVMLPYLHGKSFSFAFTSKPHKII